MHTLKFVKNVSLAKHSTMRLGGKASYLVRISDKTDIPNAIDWAKEKKLPFVMIGEGSNIIWKDAGFKGLVMVNEIPGFVVHKVDDETNYVIVGSGENWDSVVERSVAEGLHGIECLSLVPGTAGATPIQNVGAYGQDVSQTLVSVEAYDAKLETFVTLQANECGFGYRDSRFKSTDKGRFFICSLTFCLTTDKPKPPFYESLQKYIDAAGITDFSVQSIREIVIAIRNSKLPNPAKVANTGSFFGNPIVSAAKYKSLQKKYPTIPGWPGKDGKVKIPAGWLIERLGFKNFHDLKTGMATWEHQALVLVNEKAESTGDLLRFRNRIMKDVEEEFGIKLQQEPEMLP